jgi:L,D-transpeptidase ErfK/SrfK
MRAWLVAAGIVLAVAAAVGATSQPPIGPPLLTGSVHGHRVARGDTLRAIGARFGVDVQTIAFDNDMPASQQLAVGRVLHIDNRHLFFPEPGGATPSIVINVPQRMLFFDEDAGVAALPVAVGRRGWPTPIGAFTVLALEEDPTWDVPPSIQEEARRAGRSLPATVPPGPGNPLGRFWIGLSHPGIGVHGTNAPSSIYGAVTHGCIRLHGGDVAWLFRRVTPGMRGRTIYEPVLLASVDGEIYLEAHPDVYRRGGDTEADVRARAAAFGVEGDIDWERAADVLQKRHGIARVVSRTDRPPF